MYRRMKIGRVHVRSLGGNSYTSRRDLTANDLCSVSKLWQVGVVWGSTTEYIPRLQVCYYHFGVVVALDTGLGEVLR